MPRFIDFDEVGANLETLMEAISPLKVRISMGVGGVIEVLILLMRMLMLMLMFGAMVYHIIEVLIMCWSGVVLDHGLAQGYLRGLR